MADAVDREQSPPTYYANFVSSTMNADELVMELRRILKPHRDTLLQAEPAAGAFNIVPALSTEEVMNTPPLARVVMTFTAVKALKDYLDSVLPSVEESRRTGTPLQ